MDEEAEVLLWKQIQKLSTKISNLENSFKENQKQIIKEALSEYKKESIQESLKSEFLRKFERNKKSIIKQKIIEIIKTKPTNISDLKYHIVNQLNYCSKASFYRYIHEMNPHIEIKNNVAYLIKEEAI